MIHAVNSVNTNSYKKQNPGFGDNETVDFSPAFLEERQPKKRPSKASRFAGYIAMQAAAGFVVQGIFDGMTNAYRAITKKTPTIPLKDMAVRGGFTAACFAVIGLVFTAIGGMMAKKNKD